MKNNQKNQSRLLFEDYTPGNFTCVAKNAVGKGEMAFRFIPSSKKFPIYAVIFPTCVVAVVLTGAFIFRCRKGKKPTKGVGEGATSNDRTGKEETRTGVPDGQSTPDTLLEQETLNPRPQT